jgi:opacity protein-like surface antigen
LTARIAQLEAAPAVPTGFSLLTISEGPATVVPGLDVSSKDAAGYGDKATIIGIMPTADVPASTTIEWSGYVRAAIVYNDFDDNDDGAADSDEDLSVKARGQLKVVGKTDTAVGEVGVQIQLRAEEWELDTKSPVTMNEAWGWWAMTPEVTLGGGYTGSLGNVGYGYDGACSCYFIDNADVYTNPGDALQLRLSWASGPIGFAVAVEDATGSNAFSTNGDSAFLNDGLGVAAEVKYTGDTVSGEISAVWHEGPDTATAFVSDFAGLTEGTDSYLIGAGLGFALGDMASVSLAANYGRTNYDAEVWDVNALLSANLSDSIHGELGLGYKRYNDYDTTFGAVLYNIDNQTTWAAMAGLYYEPVAQLTIGVEAEYSETEQEWTQPLVQDFTYESDRLTVDFVTVYRF